MWSSSRTSELLASIGNGAERPKIIATDNSPPTIHFVRELVERKGWGGFFEAGVVDSMDLYVCEEGDFDVSVTNFGIFMLSDPVKGAAEVHRTLKLDRVAFITAWKFHGWVDLLRRISEIVRPGVLCEGVLAIRWPGKEKMVETMVEAGFEREGVEVRERREWLGFEDERDLRDLMTAGKSAVHSTSDREEGERRRIPGVIRQALTSEEWQMKGIAMDAWIVIARKQGRN